MLTKVIYKDGTLGNVDSSTIETLRNEGKIAAYLVIHRWVEVRRKRNNEDYAGLERRRSNLVTLNH